MFKPLLQSAAINNRKETMNLRNLIKTKLLISLIFTALTATMFLGNEASAENEEVFSVTLPTSLPAITSFDGTVIEGSFPIVNNGNGRIAVTGIKLEGSNGWEMVDCNTEFNGFPMNSKCFAFRFQGKDVPKNGNADLSNIQIVEAKSSTNVSYECIASPQSQDVDLMEIGTAIITVGWQENQLQSLTVMMPPTRTSYYIGENFSSEGMTINANFFGGASIPITDYTIIDGTALQEGQTTVTVAYTVGSDTRYVTVPIEVHKLLSSITVASPPNQTVYKHGDVFNSTGMVIKATYADGQEATITNYTIYPKTLSYGATKVTVNFESGGVTKTVDVPIQVKRVLKSINLAASPTKTVYADGDTFDISGATITAQYTHGGNVNVTDLVELTPTTLSTSTTQVTATYTEDNISASCYIPVTVTRQIKSLTLVTLPTKTSYVALEQFEPTGAKVTASYGITSADVTNLITWTPSVLSYGDTQVKGTLEGNEVTVPVTVSRTVKSIAITTPPTKTSYSDGDSFNSQGAVVTATYNDNSTANVTSSCTWSKGQLSYGDTSVTATYSSKTAEQSITVSRVVTSLQLTSSPTKTTYSSGQTFDTAGMVVTATYADGGSEVITDYTISPQTMAEDTTKVTVSYGNKSIEIPITIASLVSPKGKSGVINGYYITAANSGDTSNWVAIAQNGDSTLIIRANVLDPVNPQIFGKYLDDGNMVMTYDISELRVAMNSWYANTLSTTAPIKLAAMTNDCMSTNMMISDDTVNATITADMISKPIALANGATQDIAFAPSWGELASYCAVSRHAAKEDNRKTFFACSAEAAKNWGYLEDGTLQITYFSDFMNRNQACKGSATRSHGLLKIYVTILSNAGVVVNQNIGIQSSFMRPAMWVKTDMITWSYRE